MKRIGEVELHAVATAIDARRAAWCRERFAELGRDTPLAAAVAVALATAYPAQEALLLASPDVARRLAADGWHGPRDVDQAVAILSDAVRGAATFPAFQAELRRVVQRERARIALRELLPPRLGGADVDVTSAELAALAQASIAAALDEAQRAMWARCGAARRGDGAPSRLVVLGMGKLGGGELNPGSDVDLVFVYDTDDGNVIGPEGAFEAPSLHELHARVARRVTAALDEVTADGFAWRVDLRLRPEGSTGPIVNSVAALLRYYETFGRTWERAALLRARPVAGDLTLGDHLLRELATFVYRRRVEPAIASDLVRLVVRARVELCRDPSRDLKHGPGGIREAETFVQALQLVWGGREPRVRARATRDALRRLRAGGLVTDREGRDMADAYLFLRRAEHAVQWSTGQQTHLVPAESEAHERIARALGYDDGAAFEAERRRIGALVEEAFGSLTPGGAPPPPRWAEVLVALDARDATRLTALLAERLSLAVSVETVGRAGGGAADLARDLLALSLRPDDLLGSASRERYPELADTLLDAVADAADREQALRYLRIFSGRLARPSVYVKILGDEPRGLRRLVAVLGASASVGEAVAYHPELGDLVLLSREPPTAASARAEVEHALASLRAGEEDLEELVGPLRRAKARVTLEVMLADLAGEITTGEATAALTALADATLDATLRLAVGGREPVRGLSVIAMGKLGGREMGYGSDLDVLFVFDPGAAPRGEDGVSHFARVARRLITLLSTPHPDGPGYELDARLRPSGSQGLLVTSLEAFARYHDVVPEGDAAAPSTPGPGSRAAPWERQALLRARVAAGDLELGAAAMRVAHVASYQRGAPPAAELDRLRRRMESELARERPGRHDIKLGRGGLADVEFAVQYLQMAHGDDPRVRSTETLVALAALAAAGYLAPRLAEPLDTGYRFLRRLLLRLRVVHGGAVSLIEVDAPGLGPLARRMGLRDGPRGLASRELLERYREVTAAVRAAYEEVLRA